MIDIDYRISDLVLSDIVGWFIVSGWHVTSTF